MSQITIALCNIGSFVLFASIVNLFDATIMFLLFGILPGRVEPVSANSMLTIYTAASIAVMAYALRSQIANVGDALFSRNRQTNA